MQVKTFTGTSTKEVMARIKAELGPDAIILSNQKHVRNGVNHFEIMAALDSDAPGKTQDISPLPSPALSGDWGQMRDEWTQLRKQLMAVLKPQMNMTLLTPRQQVVLDYLEREGVREEVSMTLWEKFRRTPEEPTLSVMGEMIGVSPWLDTAWPHKFHILAGPTGSGKTSTILRLALEMKKNQPKKRILIANADRSQGKGRLYLRHYTELSGLAYKELDTPEDWKKIAQNSSAYDLILIDLQGLPGKCNLSEWLHEISGGLALTAHIHLLLSPLYGAAQTDNFMSRMQTPQAASIIWTKLDEACNYGEILNQANMTGLPVSLLSVGPELKNTLVQPKKQDIWRLLLRHELPTAGYMNRERKLQPDTRPV